MLVETEREKREKKGEGGGEGERRRFSGDVEHHTVLNLNRFSRYFNAILKIVPACFQFFLSR